MQALENDMSYVVVRLGQGAPHPPQIQHKSIAEARVEAMRLAGKHPGACFLVGEIIGAYQTQPVPRFLDVFDVPLKFKPGDDNDPPPLGVAV